MWPDRTAAALLTWLAWTSAVAVDAPASGPGAQPAWVALPSLRLSAVYDSNLFATRHAPVSDFAALFAPRLRLDRRHEGQRLRVDLGADLARYADRSSENYDDYWLDADGRWQLTSSLLGYAGAGYQAQHESRDSPDADLSGTSPTTYSTRSGQLGLLYRRGDYQARLGATLESLRYDPTPGLAALLSNTDRDRDLLGAALRLQQRLSPQTEVFVQALYDRRDYRISPDIAGYVRDSTGYRVAAGLKQRFGEGRLLEAYLGLLSQDFQEPRFSAIHALDFAAKFDWRLTPGTRFEIEAKRALLETTEPGAAANLYDEVEMQVEHRLRPPLSLHWGGLYARSDFRGSGRRDNFAALYAGCKYELSARWYVAADYQWSERDSNDQTFDGPLQGDSFDYRRHRGSLTLGGEF